jgi:hypothetical protein
MSEEKNISNEESEESSGILELKKENDSSQEKLSEDKNALQQTQYQYISY